MRGFDLLLHRHLSREGDPPLGIGGTPALFAFGRPKERDRIALRPLRQIPCFPLDHIAARFLSAVLLPLVPDSCVRSERVGVASGDIADLPPKLKVLEAS